MRNSIKISTEYKEFEGEINLRIVFSKASLDRCLICFMNLLYNKSNDMIMTDTLNEHKLIITRHKKGYTLCSDRNSFSMSQNDLEYIISMLLDYINQTAFVGQHCDLFETKRDIEYSICFCVTD